MNHDGPDLPGPPAGGPPEPGSEPTRHLESPPAAPDTTVTQANRVSRRALVAALAALFLFGSCGVAYGVYRATRDDGDTVVTLASPSPSSASASPSADPSVVEGVDLVVSELTGTSVTVTNIGSLPSGPFVVSAGGRAFFVEEAVPPGASVSFTFRCKEGPLTATADSTGTVEETDETNNGLTAGPFACASPSATPTTSPSATVSPTAEPKLPDLLVRRVGSQQLVVANIGAAAAGSFVIDAGKAGTFPVSGLAAGASHTATFACTEGTITATVDATGAVDESNEQNNSRTAGPFECLADLVVTDVGVDSVRIENLGVGDAGPSILGINGQTFAVPAIPAGGKATVAYPCFGGPIQAFADLLDEVDESNEGNNGLQVDVGPCP